MNNIQQTVVPLRIPAISPQMNACQYNFLIAVLDETFRLFKNIIRPSALDTAPNVRDDAIGTVHVTSILNLQKGLRVSGKMAYLKIINRFLRRDTVHRVPTYNLRQVSLFSLGNHIVYTFHFFYGLGIRFRITTGNNNGCTWIFPPDFFDVLT